MRRRLVVLFGAGAVGMGMCDRTHLAFGVLRQAGPAFLGQGLWVMPLFGASGVAMVLGHGAVRRWFGEPLRPARPGAAVASALLGGAAYFVTGPLQKAPLALASGLFAAWLVRALLRRSPASIAVSLVLCVAGPLVEATVSRLGLHTYARPDLLGVPIWLPGIYLHGGLLAADIEPFIFPGLAGPKRPAPAAMDRARP